jgi:hypothetical protein
MTLVPKRVNLININQRLKVSENLIFKFRILIGRQDQWRHRSERIRFRNERFPILLNPAESQQQFPSVKQIQRSFWSQMIDSSFLQKLCFLQLFNQKKLSWLKPKNANYLNVSKWGNFLLADFTQEKDKTPKTYQTDFTLTWSNYSQR